LSLFRQLILLPPTKKDIVKEVVKEAVKEAVKKIQSIEDVKTIDEERQELWEGKFKKVPVLYNAQYGRPRDVRTFIFDVSHMLETMVSEYKLKGVNDDETMLNCCLFVQKYIRYIGDVETKGQTEFWQNPEDTLTAGRGDCEDGALLMKSLTLVAGMPDWKCKVVAVMFEAAVMHIVYMLGMMILNVLWIGATGPTRIQ
jgi:predicted transglutaminase-like cysteine proteinase